MYPRQSPSTHTEALGDEVSVYDRAHAQVHALNPTAACVWRLCDGATSPVAIAAALQREMGIPEADAVVALTLTELARLHLLEWPLESREDRPAPTRRWLLERGLAAAMLPAVYTILTPSPLEAQSPGLAPTLLSITPNQGIRGATVAVTLTGTNFVAGATVVVAGADITVSNVVVVNSTTLTASFALGLVPAVAARTVTVTTAGGTSGGQPFTITLPPAGSTTFVFTGASQPFTVPAGVTTLTVIALGAQGGFGGAGGRGGSVTATLTVVPGEILNVFVGGLGAAGPAGGLGGFNGGGNGGTGTSFFASGGGGASDIRRGGIALSDRVVVAGGGGGATFFGLGGAGGGTTGGAGTAAPPTVTAAGGGTQVGGGLGGVYPVAPTSNGLPGASGTGGAGGPDVLGGAAGGGGGGGYFGGGGGAGAEIPDAGTGGGGSSFAVPGATGVVHVPGARLGQGQVTISW